MRKLVADNANWGNDGVGVALGIVHKFGRAGVGGYSYSIIGYRRVNFPGMRPDGIGGRTSFFAVASK